MHKANTFRTPAKSSTNFDKRNANAPVSKPYRVPIETHHEARLKSLTANLLGATAAISLVLTPPSLAAESFLKSTGARGILAEEEAELLKLRQIEEGKVRQELEQAKVEFEEETNRTKAGQFCATPFGIDVVGITEFIALTGALVGGVSARRRKQELEKLNEQLRTINTQLRQQARAGTLYAPGLTYAPPANGNSSFGDESPPASDAPVSIASSPIKLSLPTVPKAAPTLPQLQPSSSSSIDLPTDLPGLASMTPGVMDSASATNGNGTVVSLISIDEEDLRPEVKQCQTALKEGKQFLKDQNSGPAMVRFEKALMLARSLNDKVRERRAVRGLAAASRMSGQQRQAIKYLEKVLEISDETGDHVGDADAYGTIADIYTDIGEFEKAAEFYDKYIERMNTDGPV